MTQTAAKTAVKTDPKLTALLKDGTGAKASRARDQIGRAHV